MSDYQGVIFRTLDDAGRCVSITDHVRDLDLLPGLRVALIAVLEAQVERKRASELRRSRAEHLPRRSAPPKLERASDGALIDFRPRARPSHVVRFDSREQALDLTLSTIQDYVATAGPVGVETGGFLWGPEPSTTTRTTATRVSGPADDSKHERASVALGDPCDVERGRLRADLIPLGDWHSHPRIGGWHPSKDDRASWVERLRRSRLPVYVGVIAYRDHELEPWSSPRLAAWVTRREAATGRWVVEPAAIEAQGV